MKMLRILITRFAVSATIVLIVFVNISHAETNLEYFFGTRSSEKYNDVVVKKVISADSFILESGEKIKLIGLKAPEAPKEKKEKPERDRRGLLITKDKEEVSAVDPIEVRAVEFAREILEGKHVQLEFDIRQKNDNSQTLAYAFFVNDNVFVNAEILRNGYANLHIKIPNKKYAQELRAAYREAREEKRGLQGQ